MQTTFVSAHVEIEGPKGPRLVRGIQIGCIKLYENPNNINAIRIDHVPSGRGIMSVHRSVMLLDIYKEVLALAIILDPLRLTDTDAPLNLGSVIGLQCLPYLNRIRHMERECIQAWRASRNLASPLMLAPIANAKIGTRVRDPLPPKRVLHSDEVIIIPPSQVIVELAAA
jgi:hypothetical protein